MKDDRQLLEDAAKAAGMLDSLIWWELADCFQILGETPAKLWNPLEDDGDALRLAVKAGIHIGFYGDHVAAQRTGGALKTEQRRDGDVEAATRRAIVRAAAELGRAAAAISSQNRGVE